MSEDQKFEGVDFTSTNLDSEYYNCEFIGCNFSEESIFSTDFEECSFKLCNFTMTKFGGLLSEITFSDCKMTGADFYSVNNFSHDLIIEDSQLDYVNFNSVKLKGIKFVNCRIYEASFDDADIAGAVFDNCDLDRSSFQGTNIEGADFSTAYNYTINPQNCKLKKATFSKYGLEGLLSHLNIIIK